MLAELTILSARDIVVGQRFIHLIYHTNGRLNMDLFMPLSEPDTAGFFRAHITFTRPDGSEGENITELYNLRMIGCPRDGRTYPDTYHRTFGYDTHTHRVLRELVDRQDSASWLAHLRVRYTNDELVRAQEAFNTFVQTFDNHVPSRQSNGAGVRA